MKVIVLTINPYKEKDAILTALAENQLVTFLARGINDPKSKNAAINNILTIADIELMDGSFKYPILKSSKPLFTSLKLDMDSKYLGALMLMDEVMVHLFPDEEKFKMFPYLEGAVVSLKEENNWLMTLLIFMSQAIKLGGFQLEVNRCVICGKKEKIVAFSFVEGGFICQDCFSEDMEHDLSKEQMLLLRRIVNAQDYRLVKSDYSKENAEVLFSKFIDFMQEAFGYRFKNIRLLID